MNVWSEICVTGRVAQFLWVPERFESPPPVNKASSQRLIDWRQPLVSDQVEVCTEAEKIIRRQALCTVARTPERVGDLGWRGRRGTCEIPSDPGHQP